MSENRLSGATWFFSFATICLHTAASLAATEHHYLTERPQLLQSASQDWGTLGLNTAAHPADTPAQPLRIGTKQYAKGLGHHAKGSISIPLEGGYTSFDAEVGLQPCVDTSGSVVFRVLVDGECRFDSGVMRPGDEPKIVSVPLDGAAEELRLEVGDAGDGIACDMANWAEARLTRDPSIPVPQRADIASFARVVTSDPAREHGTAAGRADEIPAADVFLDTEVAASADGYFTVAAAADGTGCIGLNWHEVRTLQEVGLEFADPTAAPAAESIGLQYWEGKSLWQGDWHALPATVKKSGDGLVWQIAPPATQRIRWIFPASAKPVVIKSFSALAPWSWRTTDIRVESTRPAAAEPVRLQIYNGHFVDSSGSVLPQPIEWNASQPIRLKVQYSRPKTVKVDRTVLLFETPQGAFAVGIEDVLASKAVHVPHAHVFVTRDPAPITLAEYVEAVAGRKSVLEQVRALPDQTFSQALAITHNPIQEQGPMLVSLACDNRKFVAHRDGTITFIPGDAPDATYPSFLFDATTTAPLAAYLPQGVSYRQLTARFGSGTSDQYERHLDGGWLPRPMVRVKDNGVAYSQRAYVTPVDRQPSTGAPGWLRDRAVCIAEYRMHNPGKTKAKAALSLALPLSVTGQQGQEPATFELAKEGFKVATADRLVAFVATDALGPLAAKSEAGSLNISGVLPPGGSASLKVYLPAWKLSPSDYAVLLEDRDWAGEMEAYWNEVLAPAMRVELPDALLSDVIRASQVHCMLAARNEDRGSRVAAWVGADRYTALESESHSVIRGMEMTGCDDFARRSLEYFVKRYNPQGFLTTGYTVVGTGEHLWTLGEFLERHPDAPWFSNIAAEFARVSKWIVAQRAKTKQLDAHGEKVPEYGLMPPGVSADWDRFAYRIFNDAQYCAGLEAAAQTLAGINHPDATALADDAQQYREDLLRSYHWMQSRSPVIPLNSGAWVPYYPSLLDCFGNIDAFLPGEDWNRSWCYSIELGAHHLVATGLIEPNSDEATRQVEHLEDEQFLRSGMGDYPEEKNRTDFFNYGGFSKVQPYYCRIVEIHALRDDVKPFIRSYFNSLATLLNRENLSFWEHFHNTGGWNKTHETGWFLCQTAIMLATERGDELWLAPFVTNNWLKDGKSLSVANLPTRFGPVSYRITSHLKEGAIEAQIDPPTRSTPKSIVLRLRHPDDKPFRAVTVNGQPHANFDAKRETITLPASDKPLDVRAEY